MESPYDTLTRCFNKRKHINVRVSWKVFTNSLEILSLVWYTPQSIPSKLILSIPNIIHQYKKHILALTPYLYAAFILFNLLCCRGGGLQSNGCPQSPKVKIDIYKKTMIIIWRIPFVGGGIYFLLKNVIDLLYIIFYMIISKLIMSNTKI